MLWNVSDLKGYRIAASDDVVGSVKDLLFDDHTSKVRYLVVDTGEWLPGRQVLLAPQVAAAPDPAARVIPVRVTREQVESSPELGSDAPVSRREETRLHAHYGWAPYWASPPAAMVAPYWGAAGYGYGAPGTPQAPGRAEERIPEPVWRQGDPHLRSAGEVTGYYIQAKDGDLGHVEDLLVDDAEWAVRYIVVDTRNWLPGRKVLVSPQWLAWVDWASNKVGLELDKESIRNSPEYDPSATLDRAYEESLHRHYGRPLYWE